MRARMPFSSSRSARPAEKPRVHVVELCFLRCALFDVSFFNPFVDFRILAVLVILILIELVGVIRRIADDDADLAAVLAADTADVVVAQGPNKSSMWPRYLRRAYVLSSVSTKQRLGYSRYSPAIAA